MHAVPSTIPHAAQSAALRWGDAVALIEGDSRYSFVQLWDDCRAATLALLARGIVDGDRIAVWAPNSYRWIVAAVAIQTCGAAVVPINTRLKGREAGDILRRTGARMLFTVDLFLSIDFAALLVDEDLPMLSETLRLDTQWNELLAPGQNVPADAVDDALARLSVDTVSDIIFTSGTTGTPKGVLMTHGRILPQVGEWIANTGLAQGERYLIVNPFFHSFGFKVGWVACLMAGAVIVPMAQFEVAEAASLIERERIAFLPGPPTIFQMLLDHHARHPFDASSLRGGTTGAATVPPSLVERIRTELGMRDIITAYGMTECVNITGCRPGDPVMVIAETCGRAIAGNEVMIVDPDGRVLPTASVGEILVRGDGIMLGYLDDPHATQEAIDPHGWLHTGDIGSLDDAGNLRITDRKKDLFITGGFNCYPAEIEKLMAAHPAVAMIAVVGVPDERMGEIGIGYVVRRGDTIIDESELLAWARSNMANYKVPKRLRFVTTLPLNAAGKIDKLALKRDF